MSFTRNTIFPLMASVAVLFSPAVFAIKNQVCPNCTTDRMLTAARAAGLGTIYVWDPYSKGVHKFYSYCGGLDSAAQDKSAIRVETAPSPYGACGTQNMATDELPVEQPFADVVPHLSVIWIATNGTWVIGSNVNRIVPGSRANSRGLKVPLPVGFGGYYPQNPTVQDFMTDYNLRGHIRDYVDEHGMTGAPSLVQMAVAYAKANINATLAYTQGIVMNFEVVFPDGSSAVFTQPLTALPKYEPESGRDTAGHAVPEGNSAQFAGRWNYDPSHQYARGKLLDLIDRYGIDIHYIDRYGNKISCDWDGHTLHCVVRR